MRGFTRFFADWTMAFGGQHFGIWLPEIAVADCPLAIVRWQRLPELATGLTRSITNGQADNPACLAFQGDPDPDFLGFGAYKRPDLVKFADGSFGQGLDGLTNRRH